MKANFGWINKKANKTRQPIETESFQIVTLIE